jgi:REP element-mobilizing transposase RayT
MSLSSRDKLPHDIPRWIDPTKETYFITVCCQPRAFNQLAKTDVAQPLIETVVHRNAQSMWSIRLALLMPDHVHFIASFPDNERKIKTIVSKWKEWTAKSLDIRWQRDFFEHRFRKDEDARVKADYILANPVRAGLVAQTEDWPYVFLPEW